jgi:hypothetical protein
MNKASGKTANLLNSKSILLALTLRKTPYYFVFKSTNDAMGVDG